MTIRTTRRAGASTRLALKPSAAPIPLSTVATGQGSFAGYASLFGVADSQGDTVQPGAFAKALATRGPARIAMLYQHDVARPVGTWTRLVEDAQGLWVEGRLALDAAGGQEAHALLAAGALSGLSIGFHAVRAARRAGGGRVLHEIDLWEVSLVTFPMLDAARVSRIKARPSPPARTPPGLDIFTPQQSQALARVIRRAGTVLSRPAAPSSSSRPKEPDPA